MDKIKILHIIKSLGRGGAETLLPESLKLHDRDKFEFHYIYFLPWKDQMVSEIEKAGGRVSCIKAKNNFSLIGQVNKVINYCKVHKIDKIHCHLPWSGFLGRVIYYRTKIPVIYTEHNIQERYHFLTKWLNRVSFNQQTLAIGVSKDVTKSINQNINPSIKVHTLLNGVNTNKFKRNIGKRESIRNEYNIPLNAIVVGNIAVFRKQKSIPDWLKAFKIINAQNPEVYGLLVGSGPEEHKIKILIQDLGLTNRIILPGLQTDTVAYFSAMDIFLMSSEFEGLPIALLEAMSSECAIVSTKAGGVTEVVENNKNGFLKEVGDIKGLADMVNLLIQNPDNLTIFQNEARERVIKYFSLTNMVNNLENFYSKSTYK
jgi:L-malate glycosyltransferase